MLYDVIINVVLCLWVNVVWFNRFNRFTWFNMGRITKNDLAIKFATTLVVYKIESYFLVQWYGLRGWPFKLCQSNLAQTDPCCQGNENLIFLQKICHNAA